MKIAATVLSAFLALTAVGSIGCSRHKQEAVILANEGDQIVELDPNGAISKYEQAVQLDPSNHRILYKLAKAQKKKHGVRTNTLHGVTPENKSAREIGSPRLLSQAFYAPPPRKFGSGWGDSLGGICEFQQPKSKNAPQTICPKLNSEKGFGQRPLDSG